MPGAISRRLVAGYRPETALALTAVPVLAVAGALLYCRGLHALGADGVLLPALLVVMGAAAISSIAGFAFSALSGAALLHLVTSPIQVVQIMLVCSIGIQSLSVWSFRRHVDWTTLSRLLAGGMLGVPAGLWLLTHLSRLEYTHALGAMLTVYGVWMILRRRHVVWVLAPHTAIVAGFLGGITGGMAALPGALAVIWCGIQGWDKERQRGVAQPFILCMQIVALSILSVMRSTGLVGVAANVAANVAAWGYLPAALLGTMVGLHIFRRLTDRQFGTAVNVLLIVSGAALLV